MDSFLAFLLLMRLFHYWKTTWETILRLGALSISTVYQDQIFVVIEFLIKYLEGHSGCFQSCGIIYGSYLLALMER